MMKALMYVATAALVTGLLLAGCEKKTEPADTTMTMPMPAPSAVDASIAQKTCPVMGGAINKDIYVDYEGRRIYFCCEACPPVFQKDPAKYLAKVDEELKKMVPTQR
jgi:YHS domain-containing protein